MISRLFFPVFALLLLGLVACGPLATGNASATTQTYVVVETDEGSHRFEVDIADEPAEQARGLMFVREMPADEGMLFLYPREAVLSYYMRNTYIPLDIIFVNAEGIIETIARQTTPLSEDSILSGVPVNAVLEINGGLSDELGISEGDRIRHPFFEG